MLEPVRQYAHKRLEESDEAEDVRWRHAAFLTELTEEAEPELRRPEQAKWLERLEAEHDNVRAALSWSLGGGGHPGLGLRLASALPRFWLVRGHNGEGVRWLEEALSKGEAELASIERARALHGLGDFLKERNEFERAEECLEQALTIYEELGDQALASYVLGTMGFAAMRQGDRVRATAHFERAIAAGRESGNLEALSDALSGLGWIAASGEDYARTRRLQEDGLAVMREQEHVSPYVVGALANVAFFEVTQGNHQRAITLMEEGLTLSRQLDYKVGLWVSLFNLGLATTLNGDPMRGDALLKEALMIVRELEIDRDTTENLVGLAVAAGALGQHARAARLWGADEAIRESTGVRWISEERKLYEPLRDAARSRTAEVVWETAFAEGKAMGLAEAVAYALSEEEIVGHVVPAAPEEQSAGSQPPDLTRREREVAQMVAKGLTNRRIAQELVISEHTVENHVARILKKLNLHSREQIASRLTQH